MAYDSLAACAADLEANGQLKRITIPIDPYLEMAAIQRRAFRAGAPALLFTNPKGCGFPMLANLFGTRERARFIFRDSLENLKTLFQARADFSHLLRYPQKAFKLLPALAKMRPARSYNLKKASVLANVCQVADLPRLLSWPQDGGPFITLPLVYSEHPDRKNSSNLGMYRIQLGGNAYKDDEVGLHYQLQRGIGIHHAAAIKNGQNLPVHVHVGGPPALSMAAVMPMPEGMSELVFAGILGHRRVRLAAGDAFELPVFSDCDFLLRGHIMDGLKPEGPFGDHLGYYSLRHDFPVLKIDKVFHRDGAIWPFTSVGRPPQEDTILGEFIHEFTAPLVPQVFPGVREVHAVDAAGVHPLLLAIGEERYVPYQSQNRPAELLAHAFHLLGTTQTAQAKFLLIAEDALQLSVHDVGPFLRHMLERTDFNNDLHFLTHVTCDTLDYSGSGLNEGSKLIWASSGSKRRSLGTEISGLPDMPNGFGSPKIVAPGIMALEGPSHASPRSQPDSLIENGLMECLSRWPGRNAFPLVVVVDNSEFAAATLENFLWTTFTRADPATDTYGVRAVQSAKHWSCEPPLLIDARQKAFHAPPLEEDPEVVRRVEDLARKGGPLEGIIVD